MFAFDLSAFSRLPVWLWRLNRSLVPALALLLALLLAGGAHAALPVTSDGHLLTAGEAPEPAAEQGLNVDLPSGWSLVAGGPGSDTGGQVLFGFDGSSYLSTSAPDLEPDRGYWVRMDALTSVLLTDVAPPRTIALERGWNLVGNTTAVPLALPTGTSVFVFEGGSYRSTTVMQPGQGAWLRAEEPGSMLLPDEPPQEQTLAEWDAEDLQISFAEGDYAESVTQSLTLPLVGERGSSVSWSTSEETLVSATGVVTAPASESRSVTLTATVQNGAFHSTRPFVLKVIRQFAASVLHDNTLEDLEVLNPDGELEVFVDEQSSVGFIDGRFTTMSIESPREAIHSLNSVKTLLGMDDPGQEFVWLSTNSDGEQISYRLQQVSGGLKAFGREVVITTDAAGNALSLTNGYLRDLEVPTVPATSAESGESLLLTTLGPELEVLSHKLVVFALPDRTPALAWKYELEGVDLNEDYAYGEYFVDAVTGQYLGEVPLYMEASVDATGVDVLGARRSFTVYQLTWWEALWWGWPYEMHDRGRDIKTYQSYSLLGIPVLPGNIVNGWENSWPDPAAVSAHANLAMTYDYYRNVLNRDSIDNKGMDIVASVHVTEWGGGALDNAYWRGWAGGQMAFGDGDNRFIPLSAGLDVVAHEFTHGVVQHTAGLKYLNSSGALNESYADILGNLVEDDDDGEWLIGEDVVAMGRAMRSMSDPNEFSDPKYLRGNYYEYPEERPDKTNDYGGVHSNSGILNHAAYRMWANGITDKRVLARLWYKSLLRLDSTSDYRDARAAVISAAKDMGLSASFLTIIRDAFDWVGIKPPTAKLVGRTVVADGDTDPTNNEPLARVSIEVARNSSVVRSFTDDNGTYVRYVDDGAYVITASKPGYLTETQVVEVSSAKTVNQALTIELIPESFAGFGDAGGRIVDAVTGEGVPGLTLLYYSGINSTNFLSLKDVGETGPGGEYLVEDLPAGNYFVHVVDEREVAFNERYLTRGVNIKVLGGLTIGGQDGSVTNILGPSQLRIVLQWEIEPPFELELDAHLLGPSADGQGFEVYWYRDTYWEGGSMVAQLYSQYGAAEGEDVITLHRSMPGTYQYFVQGLAGYPYTSGPPASVQVFGESSSDPIFSRTVPNLPGDEWTVFTLDGTTGEIIPVDTMYNTGN